MKMINTNLLVEGIKAYLIDLIEQHKETVDILEFNVEVQNIIEGISKTGGWTPVEEGIPTDGRFVLLSFENFSLPAIGRCEVSDDGFAFYIGDEEETCVQQDLFVNAWMDLPERYNYRDEEKK